MEILLVIFVTFSLDTVFDALYLVYLSTLINEFSMK